MNGYKLVQLNMRPKTFAILEKLKTRLNCSNRAETVKRALELSDIVSEVIKRGGRVVLEEPDGTKNKLLLPILSLVYSRNEE